MRTIPDICQYLQKLDHYIEKVCILAFTDGHIPSNIERELLSLPVKLKVQELLHSLILLKRNTKIQETLPNL